MARRTIIHIRHGETDWNAAQRLQGQQERELNATGLAQAADAGRRLKQLLSDLGRSPSEFAWVASPMRRAQKTMRIVREEVGVPPNDYRVEPRFRELSYGDLEGLTYEEVAERYPENYAELRADKWTFLPPGGENYVSLSDRVRAALSEIPGDCIIVAHGGVYRVLIGILRDVEDHSLAEVIVPQDRFLLWQDGEERWV